MTGRTTACGVPGTPGAPGPGPTWQSAVEHRARFQHVMDAARLLLADEPSACSRRAAAGRIARAVLSLADQLNQAEEQR